MIKQSCLSVAACLLFLAIFLLPNHAVAQAPARFSEAPNEFVDQLGQFMTVSKRPDLEESYSVFKKLYKTGAFSDDNLKHIILVSNVLRDQKLTPYPYFKNYLNALSAARVDADTTLFRRWHNFAEAVLIDVEKGKVKPIGQFLEFSADFMEQRALKVGEGGSVTWKIKKGSFDFDYHDRVPVVTFKDVDLIGARKVDSTTVRKTSGRFLPFDGIWQGQGGRVSWSEAGLDSSIYAELTRYKVEAVKPLFQCDSAMMYYPLYFKEGIPGKFENNVIVRSRSASARPDSLQDFQFPRFESFAKVLKITKIGAGIEYVGGFKLAGNALYGYGSGSEPAQVRIYNKKREQVFYGRGPLFIIKRGESIVAEGVDARLYMDQDSLYHPAADLRVDIPKQVITLSKGDKGSERNPFFSSFYNMNLNTDRIAWHLNYDSLEIGARIGTVKGIEQKVRFESSNHFNPAEYHKMQMISDKNPISTLYTLWRKSNQDAGNGRLVSDNAFAQELNPRFDYSSIQTLLAEMVEEGYINYYFDRHEIELRDKLELYALASQGKRDFDAINIESASTQANAHLDLKTKETEVFDVRKIEISQRKRVAVIPYDREFTLLKNRDMRFNGRLFAGFALFEGKDMRFNYEKFQIEFDSVRHLDFYIPNGNKDKNGQPMADAMNSTIERLSGALLVDAPNNKSGKDTLPTFPSLQSKKNSFVYYDRKETQGGVYTRDSFYFKLDPFSFNSLDSYTKEQLKFKGEMTSATIFPPFKETIVVRDEDKSFGFKHKTPAKGYTIYSAKGNYTGELDLSNRGFLGKGTLEYLTADIESEDLIFRPKQTTGTAKKFFMEEDRTSPVKVPQAKGTNVSVNWLPFRDSMYVESKDKAFELFKAPGYTHKGVLVLTPSGLKGRGVFEWSEGKLTSKQISYGPFQASADTANLEIKSLDGKGIAFDSKNIDGELDFDAQTGIFKANSEVATTTLPLDQYRTSMNEFTWDMKGKTIEFKADEKKPGNFVSIDPDQDTLAFQGKTALYDMKTNLLKIGGVKVVKSADAFVYPPDTADIFIQPGGKMKQITNARILCDTITKYHTINRAVVDILGKKLYKATGYYEYNIPGHNQEVFFNNIIGERRGPGTQATKNVLTTASGDLAEKDSFFMATKVRFKGQIILRGNQPNMRFEGFAKLDAEKLPNNQWFSVYTEVDKNNPVIRIKKAENETEDPLVTGFFLSRELGDMYPRVLLPAYARVDRPILNCQDVFTYDAKNDRFIFGDSAKIVGASPWRGSRMVFDNRVGTLQAEGPLNLGSGLAYMKVKGAGRLKSDFNTVTDSTGYNVTGEFMTGMEMIIPKALMDIMVNDIKAASFDAQVAIYNTNNAFYQPAVSEFVSSDNDLTEVMANLQSNFINLPKKDNNFAFMLGRHPVIWNAEYQSFLSLEDKIPVVAINGEPFNKVLTTFVEYKMPGNQDDRFYLYIKPSADLWYFFGYQSGTLNVVSSSTKFNDALLALKSKDTQIKMPDGETYEIVAANPSLADAFVNRVRAGRKKE
ncbi:MAG: hypothetical protein JNM22_01260 [Saprospiraceae bacterium]|nr:hypothetical protein [Saprospiraceae bacterium]